MTKIQESSGNVFADIGIKDAVQHRARAQLVLRIASHIEDLKLSQTEVAKRLKISQPDVSRMLRGHFKDFAIERLFNFLMVLGHNIEIRVDRPAPKSKGKAKAAQLTVRAA